MSMDSWDDDFDIFNDDEGEEPELCPASEDTKPTLNKEIVATTIENLMLVVISNKAYSNYDVRTLHQLIDKCGKNIDENVAAQTLLDTLARYEREQSVDGLEKVMDLLATVAATSYREGEDVVWRVLQTHTENCCFTIEESVRISACRFIFQCLKIIEEMAAEEEEEITEDEEEETTQLDLLISSSLIDRWAKVLSQRRLDKVAGVRAEAVKAIGMLPHRPLSDFQQKSFFPNDSVLASLRDTDSIVRDAAIRSASFLSPEDISLAFCALETESVPELRVLLAAKLIQRVHLHSLPPLHRARIVHLLFESEHATLRKMAATRLIPRWLDQNGVDGVSPSSLLEIIPLQDDEKALGHVLKAALHHWLRECPEGLLGLAALLVDRPDFISPDDFERSCLKLSAFELESGLFILECVLDVIGEGGKCRVERARAVSRLIPTMTTLAENSLRVAAAWLPPFPSQTEHPAEESCILRVCRLLSALDHSDSYGVKAWRSLLEALCLSPFIKPSRNLLEFAMQQLLQYFSTTDDDLKELREWACYGMNSLLFPLEEEDSMEEEERKEEEGPPPCKAVTSTKWRCSIVLLTLLKHARELGTLEKTLFDNMIMEWYGSEWDSQRAVACSVIGIVCSLDVALMHKHVDKLRHSLLIDNPSVKECAIAALSDVVCMHSLEEVAEWSFPDIETEDRVRQLRLLFENVLLSPNTWMCGCGVESSLRVLAVQNPCWPSLISKLLVLCARPSSDEVSSRSQSLVSLFLDKAVSDIEMRLQLVHAFSLLLSSSLTDSAPSIKIISTVLSRILTLTKSSATDEPISIHWVLLCVVVQHVVDEPEQVLNRHLLTALHSIDLRGMKDKLPWTIKKIDVAVERACIYEQSRVENTLKRLREKMEKMMADEGKEKRKRRRPGKEDVVIAKRARGEVTIKMETEEEEEPSSGRHSQDIFELD